MKPAYFGTLILGVVLFTCSCDKAMVYDQFHTIPEGEWKWDSTVNFNFAIEDTIDFHNIYFTIRHTIDYPLSNLYLFVDVKGPSGQEMLDTINFFLAEKSGKWIGSGFGDVRDISYLYRKNARFPETGNYQISLEQAMRLPEIPVKKVGLRVEKTE